MANKVLKSRVQLLHDTSENWALATEFIPLDGEFVLYTDLKKFKIGDGVTTVVNLPFTTDYSMLKADYDPTLSVELAGGIPAYVEANGGKIDKIKVNTVEQTIVDKTVDISVEPPLPSQSGHAGEYLTTNGSVKSWAPVEAGGGYQHSDLEDLQFAAGIANVNNNWTYVSFPRNFMAVPVVVATVVNANQILEASVRNITVEGFEVCIYNKTINQGSGGEITKTSVGSKKYVSASSSQTIASGGGTVSFEEVADVVTNVTQTAIIRPSLSNNLVSGTVNYIACLDTGTGK